MMVPTWLLIALIIGVIIFSLSPYHTVYGNFIVGDILVGIAGAIGGGWLFTQLGFHTPNGIWTIVVAVISAVLAIAISRRSFYGW